VPPLVKPLSAVMRHDSADSELLQRSPPELTVTLTKSLVAQFSDVSIRPRDRTKPKYVADKTRV
jgi:hypothetical protein